MSGIAILVLKTHGAGYQTIQLLSLEPKLILLEMIPLGSELQLIIQGPRELIEKLLSQLSTVELLYSDFLDVWTKSLEKALYSLEHAPLENEMVIIEGPRLGSLLNAASVCEKLDYKIVDLKIPRGSNRWGVLILTSSNASTKNEKLIFDGLNVTRFSNPSAVVRGFFEIEAK